MLDYDEPTDAVSMLGYDPDTERRDTEWAIYKTIDAEDDDEVRCAGCNRIWRGEGWLCSRCADLERDESDVEDGIGEWMD